MRSSALEQILLLTVCIGLSCGFVEIQFEDPEGAFFIRNDDDILPHPVSPSSSSGESYEGPGDPYKLHQDTGVQDVDGTAVQFTVVQSRQPLSLSASYGPFTSRQTVNKFSADSADINELDTEKDVPTLSKPFLVDFSAHLVAREVQKDSPVLRVVFSAKQRRKPVCIVLQAESNGSFVKSFNSPKGDEENFLGELTIPSSWWPSFTAKVGKQPKPTVRVFFSILHSCSGDIQVGPGASRELGTVLLSTGQAGYRQIAEDEILHLLVPQTPVYPGSKLFVPVFIEQPRPEGTREGRSSGSGGRSSGPSGRSSGPSGLVGVVVVRAEARKGVRILGVEEASKDWNIRVEVNPRGSVATVTAFRRDTSREYKDVGPVEIFNILYGIENTDEQVWKGCKLSWQVRYQVGGGGEDNGADTLLGPRLRHKIHVHKDEVQAVLPISKSLELVNTAVLTGRQVSAALKVLLVTQAGSIADVTLHTSCLSNDDSALKVSSSCTSVYLDGSETRGALGARIQVKYGTYSGTAEFTVWMPELPVILDIPDTQLGLVEGWRVPERTFHKRSTAGEEEEKEEYEDGSGWKGEDKEVWKEDMELLEYIEGTDKEEIFETGRNQEEIQKPRENRGLQEIRNHKSEERTARAEDRKHLLDETRRIKAEEERKFKAEDDLASKAEEEWKLMTEDDMAAESGRKIKVGGCANRFQQTKIKVFARFTAEDPDSGRREYFVSRGSQLDVTELTKKGIRVQDPRVLNIRGTVLRGVSVGRTEVQMVSPVSGRVIGSSEVRVVRSKEKISGLRVRSVTGVNLALEQETNPTLYTVHTHVQESLMAKYQEGLLAVDILFSDGTFTSLRDVEEEEYYLAVESKDTDVVVFAPAVGSTLPRVVAVGSGSGDLLTVALELPDQCHTKLETPLASTPVPLTISLFNPQDGWKGDRKKEKRRKKERKMNGTIKSVDMGDISEILSNIALRDDNTRSRLDSSPYLPRDYSMDGYAHEATTLEVGMYILLGVFCIAITVFMASCFVYASKHQQETYLRHPRSRSVQNAHDWVWLGRADGRQTLDKSSVGTSASKDMLSSSMRSGESRQYRRKMNIIPNPRAELGYSPRNRIGISGPESSIGYIGTGLEPSVGYPMMEFNSELRINPLETDSQGRLRKDLNPELYAELPRRNINPKPKKNKSRNKPKPESSSGVRTKVSSFTPMVQREGWSPTASVHSKGSEQSSSRPSINSATYTRHRPIQPSQGDILPVGFPIYGDRGNWQDGVGLGLEKGGNWQERPQENWRGRQRGNWQIEDSRNWHDGARGEWQEEGRDRNNRQRQAEEDRHEEEGGDWQEEFSNEFWRTETQGFQNPWEALHALGACTGNNIQVDGRGKGMEKGADELDLHLDLNKEHDLDQPPPYSLLNRQSPASALPPLATPTRNTQWSPSREYVPINPEINRRTPPRYGSLKRVKDPFNLPFSESPAVPAELLSPNHVFQNLEYLQNAIADTTEESEQSFAEDGSSICSADSGELGRIDELPEPPLEDNSPNRTYSKVQKSTKKKEPVQDSMPLPENPTDLSEVPIGCLDYDQLMDYFQGLRESAA